MESVVQKFNRLSPTQKNKFQTLTELRDKLLYDKFDMTKQFDIRINKVNEEIQKMLS